MGLPDFDDSGLLPPNDYEMTYEELANSMLVEGPARGYPSWDRDWRCRLVENLGIMVEQLWEIGISEIFVNGSFVEDKDHPDDIDGYFECEALEVATDRLQSKLNDLDSYKIWTWDPQSRRPYKNRPKWQLPMWHRYRVELYPHYTDLPQPTGIKDEFGNDLHFPAAFRKSRREHKPKGIVKIIGR